jgi:aspartate/methionine/tyrosine aminotransferase
MSKLSTHATIDPFYAIEINHLAQELIAQGRSVIQMQFGQPSTGAPSAAIAAAHHVLDTDGMGYWESPKLVGRLARYYDETYGIKVDPKRFILTCGSSPALVLALSSSFAPGARIAMARPGYVAYRNTTKALHLLPIEIDCRAAANFRLSAASVAALEPAPDGLIVASPANPTGAIIGPRELEAITRICRERKIQIISDEIYHGISYGEPAHCMLEFEPSAIVVNSFSKYFSMVGWRLGWLLLPPERVQRARAFFGNLFLTAPSLSQHAALAALDCRDELQAHIAVYARNRELLLDALPRLGLTNIAPPDGAFYIYADVAHLTDDSHAFCKEMLKATGVATASGIDFDPVNGRRFMRISFAVSTAEVEDAIRRLEPWFASHSSQTIRNSRDGHVVSNSGQ